MNSGTKRKTMVHNGEKHIKKILIKNIAILLLNVVGIKNAMVIKMKPYIKWSIKTSKR